MLVFLEALNVKF